MKKYTMLFALALAGTAVSAQVTSFVKFNDDTHKTIYFEARPEDRNYKNVFAWISFLRQDRSMIAAFAYPVTGQGDLYIRKGAITSRVFNVPVDGAAEVNLIRVTESPFNDPQADTGPSDVTLNKSNSPLGNAGGHDNERPRSPTIYLNLINGFSESPAFISGTDGLVNYVGRLPNGKLFYSAATWGQPFTHWLSLPPMEMKSRPVITVFDNTFYVAATNRNNQVMLTTKQTSGFVSWTPLGIASDKAPSLCVSRNTLYFFVRLLDGRVLYKYQVSGQASTLWGEIPFANSVSAPVAATNGNRVFVAMLRADRSIYLSTKEGNGGFGAWTALNQRSDEPPALVAVSNLLYVFAVDGDRIRYTRSLAGGAFDTWQTIDGSTTQDYVSAAYVNGRLIVVMKKTAGGMKWNEAVGEPFFSGGWRDFP